MLAELLRDPLRAAPAAELADGGGDGLPDLLGAGILGLLQRRHEQGAGSQGADAEVVPRDRHHGPP
ncbi:MAG: hypothetical protein ACM32E_12595 [Gemmatimonadota bacterium]